MMEDIGKQLTLHGKSYNGFSLNTLSIQPKSTALNLKEDSTHTIL